MTGWWSWLSAEHAAATSPKQIPSEVPGIISTHSCHAHKLPLQNARQYVTPPRILTTAPVRVSHNQHVCRVRERRVRSESRGACQSQALPPASRSDPLESSCHLCPLKLHTGAFCLPASDWHLCFLWSLLEFLGRLVHC